MRAKKRGPKPPRVTSSAEYHFRQRFRVPAEWAFRWCIDYTPYDWKDSATRGSRSVRWLGPTTVALDDTFPAPSGGRVRKVKVVQIYPNVRKWVSTHIAGPNLHSQFRYSIAPAGSGGSALLFEGRDLVWSGGALSPKANKRRSRRLRSEDAEEWKRLAAEMERDYRAR